MRDALDMIGIIAVFSTVVYVIKRGYDYFYYKEKRHYKSHHKSF